MTQKIPSKELISRAGSERALLGICLNDPTEIISASSSGLLPDMFAVDGNRYIYMSMLHLTESGNTLDPISILSVFQDEKAKKSIEELGGIDYLEGIKLQPEMGNAKLFIDQIKQAAARRAVYDQAQKTMQQAVKAAETPLNEFLQTVEGDYREIALEYQVAQGVKKLGEGMADRLKQRLLNPTEVIGLKTGWHAFDLASMGLVVGELTVVGARSKVGKSTTLLNWCKKICVEDGIPTLYIDTEMYKEEQEDKLLSMISGVQHKEIRNGYFGKNTHHGNGKDKVAAVQKASQAIGKAPFYHIYMPHFTLGEIASVIRKHQMEHGIQLVVFDYIKLPSSNSNLGEKEYQALGYLTSGLKDLAGLLQIPIATAVQLGRAAIGKGDEMDEGDIAGSDRILQLVNRVCYLRKSSEDEEAMTGATHQFKIIAQRMGEDMDWTPVYTERGNWRQSMEKPPRKDVA